MRTFTITKAWILILAFVVVFIISMQPKSAAAGSWRNWNWTPAPVITDGVVQFCVDRDGDVTVVGDSFNQEDCGRGETLVTLNTDGNVGPQGPTGPAGPKGDKGDTGASGAVGPTGSAGAAGTPGTIGATGLQGLQGAQGEKGEKGDTGAAGAKGDTGAQGPKGDTGATGETGPAGTGSAGSQGVKGDTGISAFDLAIQNGFVGLLPDWLLSLKGEKGEKGEKGDPGVAGTNGTNGTNGADGAAAAKGDSAFIVVENEPAQEGGNCPFGGKKVLTSVGSGATTTSYVCNGANGAGGAAGTNGADGAPGAKGEKGDKGEPGVAGTNGTNGVSGSERVSANSATDSTNKSASVTCTAGKKVLGGGGSLSVSDGSVTMWSSSPSADDSWTVVANETGAGTDANWMVTAFAICASVL